MVLYKYQGAGNDFLVADNRDGKISLTPEEISQLCDRRYGIGADGVMLLEEAPEPYGFKMVYYNSDGSGGMMCGNGGRCIAAFAHRLSIDNLNFIAADGPHEAEILAEEGPVDSVKLKMKDVHGIEHYIIDGIEADFLDTGTRHLVIPVENLEQYPVVENGRKLRYSAEVAPVGANANFIEPDGDTLKVRTYEKGVEDETYACGTGITAAAIAHWHLVNRGQVPVHKAVHISIQAKRDRLAVDFIPTPSCATDVYLTGPATFVAKIVID
ncbi:MAG: diaminopimelate epimerase [Bacteroidales bacterium]|nr:diaminopimelate epimerase [Bacteroidales bacterium]